MSQHSDLLPWSWKVTPTDPSAKCPSSSLILGVFFAINFVVSIASVLFGHRVVANKLTCGLLGKPMSKSWMFMWVVVLALQFAANLINAWLLAIATGYQTTASLWDLAFLFFTRPRASWIMLGSLMMYKQRSKTLDAEFGEPQGPLRLGENRASLGNVVDYPFSSAGLATLLAEWILQVLALIPLGKVVHFAARNGYYHINSQKYKELPHSAHLMFAGALFALVTGCYLVLGTPILIGNHYNTLWPLRPPKIDWKHKPDDAELLPGLVAGFGLYCSWVSLWIFWAGYLQLAGRQYCPPDLLTQGAIWIAFTIFGVALGAGV